MYGSHKLNPKYICVCLSVCTPAIITASLCYVNLFVCAPAFVHVH